ncbi:MULTISPECIES: diguanylate cyclase [Giesbergeria]|uniref:diguanylate cyclase n=1 Tax=Giesbergeria sinuosa TaxID=80883 RepID=A0ABV9QC33_9BURK
MQDLFTDTPLRQRRFCGIVALGLARWLAVLAMLCILCAQQAQSAEAADAHILFINSYHPGYSWSDGIEEGFRERLNVSGKKIELSIEYLDSRRFPYGAQTEPLAQAMEAKYTNYRPSLIVVSDNAAFDFVIQHRTRLFAELPIVFCGYNNFRPDVIQHISDITGINEEIAIEDTVAMALKVHPQTRTLAFIVSTGEASSKRIGEVAEESVFPKLRERFDVVVMKDASVAQIRQRLAGLPKETVLFLSGQATDQGAGRALTPAENGRLITAISPFPAYTFWDFHLKEGVIGGHIITGPEQGRTAADLALRVLDGTSVNDIPVIMTTPTRDIFDYRVMERFGVRPADLPAGAHIIHQPFSLWDSYRWQIIGIVTLLIAETVLIGLLLQIARDRRRALTALAQERAQLEHRVAERTKELQQANTKMALLSITDGLTGLANRRHFDEVLESEYARLRYSGLPLSLIILDVDYFKLFNDTYGHVSGDDCLRRIAAVLTSLVHCTPNLAARYGGEELAIILPETELQAATVLAERIRSGIEQQAIPHKASCVSHYVTVSLGVITVVPTALSVAAEAVKLADAQLYQAKANGRNRVVALDARPHQGG